MTNDKLKYRVIVIIAAIIGFALGLVGLSKIVKFTVPWLVLLYPSIIVIILSSLYYNFDKIKRAVTVGVIVSIVFGLGDMLSFYGLTSNYITKFSSSLPLGTLGLGWVLPTIIVMGVIQLIVQLRVKKNI